MLMPSRAPAAVEADRDLAPLETGEHPTLSRNRLLYR